MTGHLDRWTPTYTGVRVANRARAGREPGTQAAPRHQHLSGQRHRQIRSLAQFAACSRGDKALPHRGPAWAGGADSSQVNGCLWELDVSREEKVPHSGSTRELVLGRHLDVPGG